MSNLVSQTNPLPPSLTQVAVGASHPANLVSQHLLPAVGVLFAVYLVGLLALVLVTAASKLTVRRGAHYAHHAHHALLRRTLVVLPEETLVPSVSLVPSVPGSPS